MHCQSIQWRHPRMHYEALFSSYRAPGFGVQVCKSTQETCASPHTPETQEFRSFLVAHSLLLWTSMWNGVRFPTSLLRIKQWRPFFSTYRIEFLRFISGVRASTSHFKVICHKDTFPSPCCPEIRRHLLSIHMVLTTFWLLNCCFSDLSLHQLHFYCAKLLCSIMQNPFHPFRQKSWTSRDPMFPQQKFGSQQIHMAHFICPVTWSQLLSHPHDRKDYSSIHAPVF